MKTKAHFEQVGFSRFVVNSSLNLLPSSAGCNPWRSQQMSRNGTRKISTYTLRDSQMLMATQSSYSPTISGVLSFFSCRYDQVSQDLDWEIFSEKIIVAPHGSRISHLWLRLPSSNALACLVHHIAELFSGGLFRSPSAHLERFRKRCYGRSCQSRQHRRKCKEAKCAEGRKEGRSGRRRCGWKMAAGEEAQGSYFFYDFYESIIILQGGELHIRYC